MPTVYCIKDANSVQLANSKYVGRPSYFGNPFAVDGGRTIAEALAAYREWLLSSPGRVQHAKDTLKGKDLLCWCDKRRIKKKECHAFILIEVANS